MENFVEKYGGLPAPNEMGSQPGEIKENRGNWLPLLHFLGVIRWVDVVLLTPTVTNICSKANSALNEVRFRRTDFGFSTQGLNLLRVMKRTQPKAFLPSKSSLF